jgi:hypothetical protein
MEQAEFNRAEDAIAYISEFLSRRLQDRSLSAGVSLLVAQDLVSIWAKPAETINPRRSSPAHLADLNYVIRNDDLKLLDSTLDGLKASAAAGFFILAGVGITGTAVATVGMLAGFLKLAYNAVTKGAILSKHNYSILAALFGEPAGLTDQAILDRLLTTEPDWTIEGIRDGLTMLTEVPSRSGKIAMVWKSTDARWRTTGI